MCLLRQKLDSLRATYRTLVFWGSGSVRTDRRYFAQTDLLALASKPDCVAAAYSIDRHSSIRPKRNAAP
jgi:hypothetical protein